MVVLDQYRMQEVVFAHAGFLAASTWSIVPLAWLEHHLMTPVMARFSRAKPVEITYDLNGKWVDATEAARQDGNPDVWQRVHVRYDNGLQITANQREEPLSVNGHVLDRFGWLAEGAGVTAWTARRNGTIADFAETSDRVFANARASSDWNLSATKRIRPVVSRFEAFGPREIKFTYGWQVHDVLSRDFACFVHFGRAGASELEILLQQDHVPTVPTSQWKPEQTIQDGPYTLTIPGKLPNGDYAWTIGLFRTGESRVVLEGPTDGFGPDSPGYSSDQGRQCR